MRKAIKAPKNEAKSAAGKKGSAKRWGDNHEKQIARVLEYIKDFESYGEVPTLIDLCEVTDIGVHSMQRYLSELVRRKLVVRVAGYAPCIKYRDTRPQRRGY